MQIQLFNVSTKITRQQWLPIGAIMGALILAAIGAAYIPAIASAPTPAQVSGALCALVAALAAVGIFLPKISGPKMAVRYEPGGAIVEDGGERYMVLPDGTTFNQSGGIAASRYTDIALRWQVVSFFRSRPKALPGIVAIAAIFSILLIWAEVANPGSNPFAEQAIWLFPMLSKTTVMLINLLGILLAVLSIIALFGVPVVREIAHEIRQQAALKPGAMLLESGETLEGLAAPYKMLCSRKGESSADFLARVEQTRVRHTDNYVVAVPMGTDIVAIACPTTTDSPTVTEISEERTFFVPSAPPSEGESFEVYAVFVREFAPAVRKWVTGHQAKTSGAFTALSAAMRVSCIVLAFCVSAFAQPKSVQVAAYMGDRHPVASQGVDVLFAFQQGTLRRTGDGAKTVQQLLQDGLAFSDDDNAGFLKEIFIGGTKIPPAARPTVNATAAPVSALPIGGAQNSSGWSLPDSAEVVKNVYRWKGEAAKANKQFMFVTFYYWGYASWWMRTQVFAFLFILLFVFGLVAVSCSSEFMVNTFGNSIVGDSFRALHKGSAFLMACTLIIFGLVIGLDLLISAITSEWHWLAVGALSIALGRVIGWAIGKIVPNGAVVGSHGDSIYQNSGQRRIG